MSVSFHRGGWEVRWRDASGRRRARRFPSEEAARAFDEALAEEVEAGELAAKTVNNALGTLVVCLNSAVDDGLLAVNAALRVQRLPPAHIERDYLRLDEIPRYLDA